AGSQEESFSAWTQFLLSLAHDGPAVLVFEDLHWADAALVAFLAQLADTATSAPVLLVVTARPSVAERHPDWLGRASTGRVVQLVSLGDDAVRALLEGALGDAAPALIETVLERAAGSPLYAEQLAALIRERGLEATEGALDASAIPLTIQSLLGARIDALPKELKPALLDASVIGRVFWSGAVGALEAQGSGAVTPVLDDLANRELTRPQEPSSMVGEAEYAFWHALLRDVAYSFLPRASRLAKHRAAAAWITERAGTGLTDVAEIVTDHLRRALELATALDAEDDLPAIRSDLASALIAAADHTFGIVPERAIDQLRDALELLPPGDPRRPGALVAYGRALVGRGRSADASVALEQAVQAYEDAGNELEAAEASIWFSRVLWNAGDGTRARAVVDAIRPTLEAHPGPGLVQLLSDEAVRATSHSNADEAIRHATRALSLAASLGLPKPYRAVAALDAAHDIQGIPLRREQLEEVADLAIAAGDTRYAFQLFSNRATQIDDLDEALELFDEARMVGARFGLVDRASRAQRLDTLVLAGRLDEVLEEAPRLLAEARDHGDAFTVFMARMTLYSAKAQRGDVSDPLIEVQDEAVSIGLAYFLPAGLVATIALERGEPDRARQILVDTLASLGDRDYLSSVLDLVEVAVSIGDLELARAVMRRARPERDPSEGNQIGRQARAMLLEAEGDTAGAAERYEVSAAWFGAFGWAQPQAQGLIGLGRCRLALGDTAGGLEALGQARNIAVRLGSPPLLRQVEAAMPRAPR
ncbi:MAG TPA: hypothetical protein VF484_07680, partial [Candidatus Limnocylindrales bacterium]